MEISGCARRRSSGRRHTRAAGRQCKRVGSLYDPRPAPRPFRRRAQRKRSSGCIRAKMWRKAKRRNGQAQCGAKRKRAGAGVSLTRWLRHGPVAADERGLSAFLKKGLAKNGKSRCGGVRCADAIRKSRGFSDTRTCGKKKMAMRYKKTRHKGNPPEHRPHRSGKIRCNHRPRTKTAKTLDFLCFPS